MRLDDLIEAVTYIGNNALADKVHENGLHVSAQPFEHIDRNNGNGNPLQHCRIFFHKNVIENRFDKKCQSRGQSPDDKHTEHGQDKLGEVRFSEFYETFIDIHLQTIFQGLCKVSPLY